MPLATMGLVDSAKYQLEFAAEQPAYCDRVPECTGGKDRMSNNPWPFVVVALSSLGFLANSMAQPETGEAQDALALEISEGSEQLGSSTNQDAFSRFNSLPLKATGEDNASTPADDISKWKLQPKSVYSTSGQPEVQQSQTPVDSNETRPPFSWLSGQTNNTTMPQDPPAPPAGNDHSKPQEGPPKFRLSVAPINSVSSDPMSTIDQTSSQIGQPRQQLTTTNDSTFGQQPFESTQGSTRATLGPAMRSDELAYPPRSNSYAENRQMSLRDHGVINDTVPMDIPARTAFESPLERLDVPIQVAESPYRHGQRAISNHTIQSDPTARAVSAEDQRNPSLASPPNTRTQNTAYSGPQLTPSGFNEPAAKLVANRSAGQLMQPSEQDQPETATPDGTRTNPFQGWGQRLAATTETETASGTEDLKPKMPLGPTMALFASLAANLFFGWIAWTAHSRYREFVQEVTESDAVSERRSRRSRESSRPTTTRSQLRSRDQDEAEFLSGGLEV